MKSNFGSIELVTLLVKKRLNSAALSRVLPRSFSLLAVAGVLLFAMEAAGVTVRGRVTRAGRGEPGVTVRTYSTGNATTYVATTDANGYYSMEAAIGIFGAHTWASKSGMEFHPPTNYFSVGFFQTEATNDFRVNVVGGRVTQQGGAAFPGVTVTVQKWDSTDSWTTTTDANGYYEVVGNGMVEYDPPGAIFPRRYRVGVSRGGLSFDPPPPPGLGTSVDGFYLSETFYETSASFVLANRPTVAGFVRRGNTPLNGVTVRGFQVSPGGVYAERTVQTESDGFFAFSEAPTFTAPPFFFVAEAQDNTRTFTPSRIGDPISYGVLSTFQESAALSGQIAGAPTNMAGQQVIARSWDGATTYTTTIGANGAFSFSGIPDVSEAQRFRIELPATFNGGRIVPNVFRAKSGEPIAATYFGPPPLLNVKRADNGPLPPTPLVVYATRTAINSVFHLNMDTFEDGWEGDKIPVSTTVPAVNFANRGEFAPYNLHSSGPFGAEFRKTIFLTHGADSVYTFHLTSDDGAALYVDGELLINNDGLHGAVTKSASISFAGGNTEHTVMVRYFDAGGDAVARVDWEQSGPGGFPRMPMGGTWNATFSRLPFIYTRGFSASDVQCQTSLAAPFTPLTTDSVTFTASMIGANISPSFVTAAPSQRATLIASGGISGRVTDALGGPLAGLTVRATIPGVGTCGSFVNDFSNTTLPAGATLGGSTAVITNGVLRLTPTENGVSGSLNINEFSTGPAVTTLRANFKVYIGGGNGADGFGIDLSGPNERLLVFFDTYPNVGDEPSIKLEYNGRRLVTKYPYAIRRSGFVDVSFSVDADGIVNLTYDGDKVFVNQPTPWGPSNFTLSLWGYTGGANDNHWVDDLNVTATRSVPLESVVSNFSSAPAGATLQGAAMIREGVLFGATNSVLMLTTNVGGTSGSMDIGNFNSGAPVQAYRASFRLYMGGGNGADGMTFTFGNGSRSYAVEFDTYENGDGVGVRAIANGAPVGLAPAGLRRANFVDVSLHMHRDGTLDVTYDGVKMMDNVSTGFTPMNGTFTLSGRTGGVNDNHWVDDLNLSVERSSPETVVTTVTDANGNYDFGGGLISPGNVRLEVVSSTLSFPVRTSIAAGGTVNFQSSGAAPRIAPIADQTMTEDTPHSFDFTIQGADTPASNLIVRASSANQSVLPNSGMVVTGAGVNRTLTINPAFNGAGGPINVTLTTTEAASRHFNVKTVVANTSVVDIARAEQVLATPTLQSAVYHGTAETVNFGSVPFPGLPTGGDNFVVEVTGRLTIPTSGEWTFGVQSDDGFNVRIGTESFEFPNTRGLGDTLATFNLTAGTYPVRLLYFEAGGGEMVQFFAAPGRHSSFNNQFKLVNDRAPQFTVKRVHSNVQISDAYIAQRVLTNSTEQTSVAQHSASTVNWRNLGFGGRFTDVAFPGLGLDDVDHNDFAVEITGAITLPNSGAWTFGVRSDDGFICQIGGHTFDYPWTRGSSDTLSTANFNAGTYPVRIVYYERQGGAGIEFFAAPGTHDGNSSAFQLLTASGSPLRVNESEGLSVSRTFAVTVLPVDDPPTAGFYTGMRFNGANRIEAPSVGAVMSTQTVTVEFWQKVNAAAEQTSFFLAPSGDNPRMQAHLPWSDGSVAFDFGAWHAGGRLSYTPPTNVVGTWQHWAFIANKQANGGQGVMKIYRNGVLEAEKQSSEALSPSTAPLIIGSYLNGIFPLQGELGEFRLWNVERTDREIQRNMHTPLRGDESGLLLYYRFIEGAGPLVNDFAAAASTNNANVAGSWPSMWMPNPTANERRIPVDEDVPVEIFLPGFDFDNAGLSYSIVTQPTNGTLSQLPGYNGALWSYRSQPNVSGNDAFTYRVTSNGKTAEATVLLEIIDVNDVPFLSVIPNQIIVENQVSAPIPFTVSDSDNDPLFLNITVESSDPVLVLPQNIRFQTNSATSRSLTIRPNADQIGTVTITLTANDGIDTYQRRFDVRIEPQPAFSIVDIGSLTGKPITFGGAVNDRGAVAAYGAVNSQGQLPRGFINQGLDNGLGITDAGALPGGAATLAGINADNVVVGSAPVSAGGVTHAFKSDGLTVTDLGALSGGSSFATAINDGGAVVGYSATVGAAQIRAFLWIEGSGLLNLGTLAAPFNDASRAFGINRDNDIVGASYAASGSSRAFLRRASVGTLQDLGTLSGGTSSIAYGINRFGDVVGSSTVSGGTSRRAFVWHEASGMTSLDTLPSGGDSEARAINDFGQAVGSAVDSGGRRRAVIFTQGTIYDLNDVIPEEQQLDGWVLTEAVAINNRGDIVGTGAKNGQTRAFLVVPAAVIGRQVIRPPATVARRPEIELLTSKPGDTEANSFFWSDAPGEKKLYATRPVTARIKWPVTDSLLDTNRVISATVNVWPKAPQIHVSEAPVEIEPTVAGFQHKYIETRYTTSRDASVDPNTKVFTATNSGYTVLMYLRNDGAQPDPITQSPYFEVARTLPWNDVRHFLDNQPATIGASLTSPHHRDYPGRNGWVWFPHCFIDASGPEAAYNREARTGPILPVNKLTPARLSAGYAQPLVVAWYATNRIGVSWAHKAVKYEPDWNTNAPTIVIASGRGGGFFSENVFQDLRVYNQPNASLPGFNPNEEHALILPGPSGETIYALRNDLNAARDFSEPYALLKYRDANTANREWRILPHRVVIEDATNRFEYRGDVGKEIQPPFPLSVFSLCPDSQVISGPGWRDKNNKLYAVAAGAGMNDPAVIKARYLYPLQPGFLYDLNGDGTNDASVGTCIPWLDRRSGGTPGQSIDVTYNIYWPTNAPTLQIGETLLRARRGLPDLANFFSAEILFDSSNPNGANYASAATRLFDPLSARVLRLNTLSNLSVSGATYEFPPQVRRTLQSGVVTFDDADPDLAGRFIYDPVNRALRFEGTLDEGVVGAPLLLLNVMSSNEMASLKGIFPGNGAAKSDWDKIIDELFWLTRNPNRVDLDPVDGQPDKALRIGLAYQYTVVSNGVREVVLTRPTPGPNVQIVSTNIGPESYRGGTKALIAAGYQNFTGPRFITIVENNDKFAEGPVALHVIRVDGGPYLGDLKFLTPENVFSEKLSIRHSSDFGGEPEKLEFEWWYKPDSAAFTPTDLPVVDANGNIVDARGWLFYSSATGNGVNSITLGNGGESSLLVLGDNWFIGRYRGYNVGGATPWTTWIGDPSGTPTQPRAALAEGWVKRVVRGVNPFDQRFSNFHQSEVDTFASMLIQAGTRYEGDIAFNADALGSVGLIEAYTTVLNRGRRLSIDGIPSVNFDPANNALLFASSRISDLYMLLGNEAFADATDPTIGFGIGSGEYGSAASSIHAFMNQTPNLLEEELALLRGRDNTSAGVAAPPVYNRLYWNFTLGEGELAYQQSFNIGDFDLDGFISERDARIQYPQGHGDAWGHHLTASKLYYELMRHPNFTWVPRSESVNLLGTAISIDYFDERKFARIAAHKAKVAGEIVAMTYRQKFVDDTAGQWQGYKDTDPDRAWGVTEWARRGGQAAIFDWVTANALLFAQDPNPNHTGVQKIDRSTVLELREVPVHLTEIQKQLDMADVGLNPLGVAKGSVPFDLDPSALTSPNPSLRKSHFEQIAERASKAMNNAVKIFDEANQFTALLRRNQDDTDKFVPGVVDEETDYKNRLIEIFGYPYAGDIGPGKTYPSGYNGPDTYHWMYVETTAITGETAPVSTNFSGFFRPVPNGLNLFTHFPASEQAFRSNFDTNTLETDILQVNYPVSQSAASYTFSAPPGWGQRRAPGKIQEALSDVIQQEARLKQALQNYDGLIRNIEDQLQLLAAQKQVNASQIGLLNTKRQTLQSMNAVLGVLKATQIGLKTAAETVGIINDAMTEGFPKVVGLAFDPSSPVKGVLKGTSGAIMIGLNIGAASAEIAENSVALGKEDVELSTDIKLEVLSRDFEVLQRVKEIESMMRDEAVTRLEVFTQREILNQAVGRYHSAVAEGERLLDQLAVFRQRTSASISEQRYEDMTFRLFRNEALQKYRASFDLVARYVFLAANAYDYEVNFLGSDTRAGREFLSDIVRQRTLGQIINGQPVIGQGGLAEPLARMLSNWEVLKSRYGINNPLVTDSRFSLRRELLRINGGTASDNTWREVMQQSRVANLWDLPEFRRYCRPFAPESAGAQPGLVVRFPTTVTFGLNFFGWPLSGGDSQYDPTRFATKINRVGVWFTGSDGTQISATPNVYLIPAGMDVLRSPSGNTLATREWRIVDQVIPEPFPIGQSALNDPNWIPIFDSVGGTFAEIRRFSSFPAYHDQGFYAENQTTIDSRLIGRSVWNTDWLLIIPGGTLLNDPNVGLDTFINTVDDIKIYFQTYSYSGN